MRLTKFERDHMAKTMKEVRKLLERGRSEPLEDYGTDMASEIHQIGPLTPLEVNSWDQACCIVNWIFIIGIFVAIGLCFLPKKAHANTCGSSLMPGESCTVEIPIPTQYLKPNCFDLCPGADEVNFKKCFMYCISTSGEAIK